MIEIAADFDLTGFDRWEKALEKEFAKAVVASAFIIQGQAQMNAPVDTGALMGSIYVSTFSDGSGYGSAVALAQSKRGGVSVLADIGRPEGPLEAIVAVGVEYGAHVEYGTFRAAAALYMTRAASQSLGAIQQIFLHAASRATKSAFSGSRLRLRTNW